MQFSLDIISVSPILILSAAAFVVLLLEAALKKSANVSFSLSLLGIAGAMAAAIMLACRPQTGSDGMLTYGGFGAFFSILFLVSGFVTIVISREYLERTHTEFGEFYLLIMLAIVGMMLMAYAADLIMIFVGLEMMSICLYVLAGFFRRREKSNESSLKYFLLGAFATGFFLYGIALIYGAAHTTNLGRIAAQLGVIGTTPLFLAGAGLTIVGLSFKVAAVPFHQWVPDVYEGAPTTVTGFMSTAAKAAAFSAFVLVLAAVYDGGGNMKTVLVVLAVISMVIGNLFAISQSNIKRMLAYSSVAHAGYMLVGLAAGNSLGKTGVLFYISVYTLMNLGAFGIIALLEYDGEKNLQLADYAGLGVRRPYVAALMAVFMFALSGLPPFGGFFGKYYVFLAAINANLTWLAIVGVLASLIGVYYYIRVVVMMYFADGREDGEILPTRTSLALLTLVALLVLLAGVYPSSLLTIVQHLF